MSLGKLAGRRLPIKSSRSDTEDWELHSEEIDGSVVAAPVYNAAVVRFPRNYVVLTNRALKVGKHPDGWPDHSGAVC